MSKPSATEISRVYAEIAETFSPPTTEMIVHAIADAPWDDLVTKDDLAVFAASVDTRFSRVDVRFAQLEAEMKTGFAESDARHERSMRNFAISMMAAMFTFNGALAAWLTAVH